MSSSEQLLVKMLRRCGNCNPLPKTRAGLWFGLTLVWVLQGVVTTIFVVKQAPDFLHSFWFLYALHFVTYLWVSLWYFGIEAVARFFQVFFEAGDDDAEQQPQPQPQPQQPEEVTSIPLIATSQEQQPPSTKAEGPRRRAHMNSTDAQGRTPLHFAILHKDLESVFNFIHNKTQDINITDNHGVSPLAMAANSAQPEVVKALLKAKSKVDSTDSIGCTPLHRAIDTQNVSIVKLLVENKANLELQNNAGDSAVILSTKIRNPEITSILVRATDD